MRRIEAFALCTGLLAAAAAAPAAGPGNLKSLPANKWVRLASGPGNPYANPVYDPASKKVVMLLAGGNGTAHFNGETGRWEPGPGGRGAGRGERRLRCPRRHRRCCRRA